MELPIEGWEGLRRECHIALHIVRHKFWGPKRPVLILRQKYLDARQILGGETALCGYIRLALFKGGFRPDSTVCVLLFGRYSLSVLMITNSGRQSDIGRESFWKYCCILYSGKLI